MADDRLGELGTEVHFTHLGPARDDTIAFDGVVVDETDLRLNHIVAATLGVVGFATEGATVEVEDYSLGLPFGEGITMDARARGG